MNNTSGNVGMGNIFPGAKLDLIGSLRIRGLIGSSPTAGSIMASADVNGNGKWQGIAAFRTGSIYPEPGISQLKILANTWTKLEFSFLSYNKGLLYQPLSSQFVAPVKGIYHIAAASMLDFPTPQAAISFGGTRNGANLVLPYKYVVNGSISVDGNITTVSEQNHLFISTEIMLEAGDIVWVNVYSTDENRIGSDQSTTWFTGRLITRL